MAEGDNSFEGRAYPQGHVDPSIAGTKGKLRSWKRGESGNRKGRRRYPRAAVKLAEQYAPLALMVLNELANDLNTPDRVALRAAKLNHEIAFGSHREWAKEAEREEAESSNPKPLTKEEFVRSVSEEEVRDFLALWGRVIQDNRRWFGRPRQRARRART